MFTPKGKILSLPRGATVVDFAYSIHTDIGNQCVAARINHEIQPLRTALRNGDMVEIVTGPVARPNPAWLSFVRTGKARSRDPPLPAHDEVRRVGRARRAPAGAGARQFNLDARRSHRAQWDTVLKQADPARATTCSPTSAWASGSPRWSRASSRSALRPGKARRGSSSPRARPPRRTFPVLVRGYRGHGGAVRQLLPSDARRRDHRPHPQGPGTRGAPGRLLHAQRARRADPERWIELQWASDSAANFTVGLDVGALNERGVLGRIAAAIAEGDSNILNVHVEDEDARVALIHFKIQVRDRVHLARVIRALRRVRQVVQIARPRGGARGTHQDAS